jgi:cytochrome c-type biogenesis protein CcmH/NrfF
VNIPGFPMPTDNAHIGDRAGKMRALAASASTQLFVIEDDEVRSVNDHPAVVASAIPPHTTEMADPELAWDGPAAVEMVESDRVKLRQMHAWVDDADNPDAKFAYKLPHHLPDGRVVLRGVQAAMSRLMQSETDIPADERRRVYEHLAAHYRQFDLEPPEFHVAASAAEGADMCECQNKNTEQSDQDLVERVTAAVLEALKASAVAEEEVIEASAESTEEDSEGETVTVEERLANIEAIVKDLVDDYIVRKIDSEFAAE